MTHPRRTLAVLSTLAFAFVAAASCGKEPMSAPAAALSPSGAAFSQGGGGGGSGGGSGSGGGGSSGSNGGSSSDPNFLEPASGAPGIMNPVIVFTAVKGIDKRVKMYYQPRHPGDSTVFAEFRVSQQSLLTRPDGTPINDGDSVQITMTLVDPVHGIIDFQPSGLRFWSKHPANLRVSYENADPDLNHDGVVDLQDLVLRQLIHFLVRESPDGPWQRLPSSNMTLTDDVQANILGFSGYVIEY